MEVEILSKKLIKPSAPTPNHLRNMKISFIDQLAPPYSVITILYYPNIEDGGDSKTRNGLEKSLSEALTMFYPFAGRFMKEELLVDCNDEGVAYVETRVSGRVDELIVNARADIEVVDPLVPHTAAVDLPTTPLVTVQVNNFDCGGVAIVVRVSHRIADAITGAAFINGWATACRAGVSHVVRPNFDLASHIPPRISLPLPPAATPTEASNIRVVARRFVFDATALKAKVMATANIRPPTRNEVVSAAIWRALIGTSRVKQGCLRASMLVHSVNLRGRTVPPMPDNTCGNFYALAVAQFEPDETKMELHDLVELIRVSIRESTDNCSKTLNSDEFYWAVFNAFKEGQEELCKKEEMNVHMFTSWCRIPFYEPDFGWGKPSWVSSAMGGVRMVVLNDTNHGDAVEAWVVLSEQDMLHFQQDQDILAFTDHRS